MYACMQSTVYIHGAYHIGTGGGTPLLHLWEMGSRLSVLFLPSSPRANKAQGVLVDGEAGQGRGEAGRQVGLFTRRKT